MNSVSHQRRARRGLTLVELLVVLVVLTAVAGILVPLMPNANRRSHDATGAGNLREMVKAVALHKANTGTYPDEWDSLIDADGTTTAATMGVSVLDISAPAAGSTEETIANALADAGITTAYQHSDLGATDGTVNQTFDGTNDTNELASNVAVLTAMAESGLDLATSQLNGGSSDAPVAYVAFGLGNGSTMIGQTIADAPVLFPNGANSPIRRYSRGVIVFAVHDGRPLEVVSAAMIMGNGGGMLMGQDEHLDRYFQGVQ